MHQRISKKILLYFFLFIIFGTLNNKNLIQLELLKIKEIDIVHFDIKQDTSFLSNLDLFKKKNIFFLSKIDVKKKINENELVENFSIFKKYPSTLLIKIDKTNFLAYLKKDKELFFLGSNGKLIKTNNEIENLPYIFGDLDNKEFFKLKEIIDNSGLEFRNIKNLYFFPSERWDIETHMGIMIKLPKNKLKESLELSLKIIKDKNFENIKIIDLRQKNRVIING